MRSIKKYLVATSLLLVGLVLAAAVIVVFEMERVSRRQAEQQLLATTRALSFVVDGELRRYESILRVLATSDRLASRDWAGLDDQARKIFSGSDAWIVVSDRTGRQLVNTRLPRGTELPAANVSTHMWRDLDQRRSRVCNLERGNVEPSLLCVDVAAPASGQPEFALSVVTQPSELADILRQQRVDGGTYATILDRQDTVVWRNVRPAQYIGKLATKDLRQALSMRNEGVQESYSLDGIPTVAAFSRSSYSGWTFVVAIPRAAFRPGGGHARPFGIVAAALLIFIGAAVGLMTARRVTRAAKSLVVTAEQIERGLDPSPTPTGLLEIDVAGQALQAALQARRFHEDRYRLVFEQTSDLILTATLDQVITDCNESAAKAVGVPREEAIGRNIAEFISPDDFARTTDMLRQKLGSGGTTRYDVRVRDSKGAWLNWEINSGLMYQHDGTALGLHVVARDVSERKRSEERQQLLINELNHRVKNTLAIVQALAQQSFKGVRSPQDERSAFEARLATLAAAHNLLTRQTWEPVSLGEVVETAVAAVCGIEASRHTCEGPTVMLPPQAAVSIAMAFHELCTNAVKYGALSTDEGTVTTLWQVEQTGDGAHLQLEWTERGGPPVNPPSKRGFGTRMIERALAAELGADVQLYFHREGLVCRLEVLMPKTHA